MEIYKPFFITRYIDSEYLAMSTSNSLYDINNYSDSELYDILDLNHPTDRELEAKILFMIHRYSNMQTQSGNELAIFFENIYRRFFDIEEKEEDEDIGISNNKEEEDEEEEDEKEEKTREGMVNMDGSNNKIITVAKKPIEQLNVPTTSVIGYTKTLDYAKDQLNPLLQQTIKRVISIDSQYRDDKTTMTTDFTFNLSDPLRDVVSLKLYSIQIPYTWYTISTSYGSNFIYLKGNSPGINNGNYDYQIAIPAGNYSPSELVTALNSSIQATESQLTDVSFGTTGFSYNSNTSRITMTIDINKQYNETSYELQFPNTTFANYLGFTNTSYRPYIVNSYSFGSTYNPNATFSFTKNNNYVTVVKYIGPGKYDPSMSVVDLSFQLQFSLSTSLLHTRNEIINDLNNQIHTSPYLDTTHSYIQVVNIKTKDGSNNIMDASCIQFALKPNRYATKNLPYSKFAVVFPSETGSNNILWTNLNSCFQFQNTITEINTIVSETTPAIVSGQTNYSVTTTPYILIHCIKTGFDSSLNDYRIDIPNSGTTGFTLNQYINAINTGIYNAINNSKYINNGIYEIDSRYTTAFLDASNTFNISFATNKYIHQTDFSANFAGTCLPGIDPTQNSYDLNVTNVITWNFLYNPTITIISENATILTLNYKNVGSVPYSYRVTLLNSTNQTYLFNDFQTAINNAFVNFQDPDGIKVLSGSSVVFQTINNVVTATLSIVLNKTLTQANYNIQFLDSFVDPTGNSWNKNLYVDTSMTTSAIPLANPLNNQYLTNTSTSSTIRGRTSFPVPNTFSIDTTNNIVTVVSWEDGVAGGQPIQITIPPSVSYSPSTLISAINTAIQGTDLSGSLMEIFTNALGQEFTRFRPTINKVYSASDYRVVFYDPVSFVKCYVGVSSVRNTTWDTTVGWILGFRNYTVYDLSKYAKGKVIQIVGDTGISTNLFNYFLLCLDDYNQNHLNDGLITITSTDTSIPLPSYAKKTNFICNPQGQLTYNTDEIVENNKLTQAQIYSITQIANSQNTTSSNLTKSVSAKSYGAGPFVKDVFGIIPMKVAGLANGSSYVEFGGTLQNQERTYFGPVNIHRMSVKLVSDRGDIVDLNGANWSFSLICEQLYKQKPSSAKESK
jgi:hypothetical protein